MICGCDQLAPLCPGSMAMTLPRSGRLAGLAAGGAEPAVAELAAPASPSLAGAAAGDACPAGWLPDPETPAQPVAASTTTAPAQVQAQAARLSTGMASWRGGGLR